YITADIAQRVRHNHVFRTRPMVVLIIVPKILAAHAWPPFEQCDKGYGHRADCNLFIIVSTPQSLWNSTAILAKLLWHLCLASDLDIALCRHVSEMAFSLVAQAKLFMYAWLTIIV